MLVLFLAFSKHDGFYNISFFSFRTVFLATPTFFQPLQPVFCIGLLSYRCCYMWDTCFDRAGVCEGLLTSGPSPFHPSREKMTPRLFWNVWTGTAYFTLLLIFDRCSGEAHIRSNWSHMCSLHTHDFHASTLNCGALLGKTEWGRHFVLFRHTCSSFNLIDNLLCWK